ncbi:MAG: ABC transporter ATP-binding protein [Rhodospirillales bacterium]|nr:ABC transporter ATP-binding protein [Rhodospirillales bacterium]
MAEIVLEGITKKFGDVTAVDDVSLRIEDGEFVVLLGPTGAGKTTTLRVVAGLENPESGRLLIGGVDMTNAAPHARDTAFVFQQYSLYPHYSVYENLAFPLRSPLRKWPEQKIKEKVTEVAGLLQIAHKLENKATQLSGGEMQRVAIGRALVRSPAVYLMDEPLSSLDAKLREDLRAELKRIQIDFGTTLLYVTHDQIEAMTMADRIGVLDQGRLIQLGTPREVYETPSSVYVAQRLGSPGINFLKPGSLGEKNGRDDVGSIGIRPEHVRIGTGTVHAQVTNVEHVGAETVLTLEGEGQTLLALADLGKPAKTGERVPIEIDWTQAVLFDVDGERIAERGT